MEQAYEKHPLKINVDPENKSLTRIELAVLIWVALIVIIGIVSSHVSLTWFENVYVREDGFIENLTLFPLLAAAFVSGVYIVTLSKQKSRTFSFVMISIFTFSIFVAGEEISWGQRLFNIQSSDFFNQYNAQRETNLHNLVVGDKKINKIVFSQLLTAVVACYLILLPMLYRKNNRLKAVVDAIGIPVPRRYQIWACMLLFISIILIPTGKNAEILEVGIVHLFFLILLYPQNKPIFRRS